LDFNGLYGPTLEVYGRFMVTKLTESIIEFFKDKINSTKG